MGGRLGSRIADKAYVWGRDSSGAVMVCGRTESDLYETERNDAHEGNVDSRTAGERRRTGGSALRKYPGCAHVLIAAVFAGRSLHRLYSAEGTDRDRSLGHATGGGQEAFYGRAGSAKSGKNRAVPFVARRKMAGIQFHRVGAGRGIRDAFPQRAGTLASFAKWRDIPSVAGRQQGNLVYGNRLDASRRVRQLEKRRV